MEKKRVVVTGVGFVTPLGHTEETLWNNIVQGRSGVGEVTAFDASQYATRIAAEVKDFDPSNYIDRKDMRHMDRYVQFAVAAAQDAVEQSGLNMADEDPDRVGVYIGSGIGGMKTIEEQHRVLLERGPRRVSPHFITMIISNIAAGQVSIRFGARGPNIAPVTACATSAHAIGEAMRLIQYDEADVMIAGGAEATITPLAMAAFIAAKAMSTRNEEPERACRPFDKERDGFVMGEGAGILVLESLEHAQKRGATILAELVGYGLTGDAYHVTAPHPEGLGAKRAMERALKQAGLSPEAIGYINAHGTSTPIGDIAETLAIKQVFGDHAYKLAVSSTKSMTGHLLGGAGAVETIITLLALRHQVLPPTINYENPDPECDLDYVPNQAREAQFDYALTNSFGFGGHNATIILKRWE